MTDDALAALAGFSSGCRLESLPADVTERARACLLYGLAVGVASVEAPTPRIAIAALDVESAGARGDSTRLLDGRKLPASASAFANAVLMHARVQEDAHPAGHVGVVVLPSALAVAEQVGAAGAELLAAIVAGYEVALRIGRDHVADASLRGFRSTPIYGAFGAAAAAARLLRLDRSRTAHALALAANAAGGLRAFVTGGTEEFAFQAGVGARNGIASAMLAAAGATAAPRTLDGPAGFFAAFGERGVDYARRVTSGLGEQFELLDVACKPYPTCQFHRSLIAGVLELRRRQGAAPPTSMRVRMHPFEADFFGVRFAGPFTSFAQTFMSAPFCAALAWTAGEVTYRAMHRFDDARVLALVRCIEVISDPDRPRYMPCIEATFPNCPPISWEETRGVQPFRLTWGNACTMASALLREVGADASAAPMIEAVARAGSAPVVDATIGARGSDETIGAPDGADTVDTREVDAIVGATRAAIVDALGAGIQQRTTEESMQ